MKYRLEYKNLDLYHTLISGQTFEWDFDKENNSWKGFIYNNNLTIKQIGERDSGYLEYESDKNIDKEIIRYLGLNENYEDLIQKISFDPYILQTLTKLNGLRVIKQDPWYCINSFILSSNNTVKNIQTILKNLSLKTNSERFPRFDEVRNLTEQDLRECKAGFRAKYLRDFYNRIESENDFVESIIPLSYEEGKNKLMSVKGIGEKVADCILLYAYGKYEAYPIDTHLRKATLECYFFDDEKYPKKPSDKQIRIWAKEYWGELGGFAHFFLFTYRRIYGQIK